MQDVKCSATISLFFDVANTRTSNGRPLRQLAILLNKCEAKLMRTHNEMIHNAYSNEQ